MNKKLSLCPKANPIQVSSRTLQNTTNNVGHQPALDLILK